MATLLGAHFDGSFTGIPTHISPRDFAIWRAWWPSVRDEVTDIWFDVGLGAGADVVGEHAPAVVDMWLKNTQKRADIVMRYRGSVWIVELRSAASASALGRLALYQHLWNVDPPFAGSVLLWLVTEQRDRDVESLARLQKVAYTVVDTAPAITPPAST